MVPANGPFDILSFFKISLEDYFWHFDFFDIFCFQWDLQWDVQRATWNLNIKKWSGNTFAKIFIQELFVLFLNYWNCSVRSFILFEIKGFLFEIYFLYFSLVFKSIWQCFGKNNLTILQKNVNDFFNLISFVRHHNKNL